LVLGKRRLSVEAAHALIIFLNGPRADSTNDETRRRARMVTSLFYFVWHVSPLVRLLKKDRSEAAVRTA
jgi:hypothetical protein